MIIDHKQHFISVDGVLCLICIFRYVFNALFSYVIDNPLSPSETPEHEDIQDLVSIAAQVSEAKRFQPGGCGTSSKSMNQPGSADEA